MQRKQSFSVGRAIGGRSVGEFEIEAPLSHQRRDAFQKILFKGIFGKAAYGGACAFLEKKAIKKKGVRRSFRGVCQGESAPMRERVRTSLQEATGGIIWPHLYFLAARRWHAHNVKDGVRVFLRRRRQEP